MGAINYVDITAGGGAYWAIPAVVEAGVEAPGVEVLAFFEQRGKALLRRLVDFITEQVAKKVFKMTNLINFWRD